MATLLLVEDNPNQRILYQQELENEGHLVVVVETVYEALSVLHRENVDVMVLDLAVPRLEDGLNLLEKAFAQFPQVRVIIHTGYDPSAAGRASEYASGYVVKSSDLRYLKRKIEAVLGQEGSR